MQAEITYYSRAVCGESNQSLARRRSLYKDQIKIPRRNLRLTGAGKRLTEKKVFHLNTLLLASHQGELDLIPSQVTPRFSQMGIVPDDSVSQRVLSENSRFSPPFHSGAAPFSPHFTLVGSQDLVVKSRPNPLTEFSSVLRTLKQLYWVHATKCARLISKVLTLSRTTSKPNRFWEHFLAYAFLPSTHRGRGWVGGMIGRAGGGKGNDKEQKNPHAERRSGGNVIEEKELAEIVSCIRKDVSFKEKHHGTGLKQCPGRPKRITNFRRVLCKLVIRQSCQLLPSQLSINAVITGFVPIVSGRIILRRSLHPVHKTTRPSQYDQKRKRSFKNHKKTKSKFASHKCTGTHMVEAGERNVSSLMGKLSQSMPRHVSVVGSLYDYEVVPVSPDNRRTSADEAQKKSAGLLLLSRASYACGAYGKNHLVADTAQVSHAACLLWKGRGSFEQTLLVDQRLTDKNRALSGPFVSSINEQKCLNFNFILNYMVIVTTSAWGEATGVDNRHVKYLLSRRLHDIDDGNAMMKPVWRKIFFPGTGYSFQWLIVQWCSSEDCVVPDQTTCDLIEESPMSFTGLGSGLAGGDRTYLEPPYIQLDGNYVHDLQIWILSLFRSGVERPLEIKSLGQYSRRQRARVPSAPYTNPGRPAAGEIVRRILRHPQYICAMHIHTRQALPALTWCEKVGKRVRSLSGGGGNEEFRPPTGRKATGRKVLRNPAERKLCEECRVFLHTSESQMSQEIYVPANACFWLFTLASDFSEALLKFYFHDIPPPRVGIGVSAGRLPRKRGGCYKTAGAELGAPHVRRGSSYRKSIAAPRIEAAISSHRLRHLAIDSVHSTVNLHQHTGARSNDFQDSKNDVIIANANLRNTEDDNLGSPLVDDRPIMNAVKYEVVSGVVWTNSTMVSSSTDTNRTGVLVIVYCSVSTGIRPCPPPRVGVPYADHAVEVMAPTAERRTNCRVATTSSEAHIKRRTVPDQADSLRHPDVTDSATGRLQACDQETPDDGGRQPIGFEDTLIIPRWRSFVRGRAGFYCVSGLTPLRLLGRKIMQGDMHRGKEGLGGHGLHFGAMTARKTRVNNAAQSRPDCNHAVRSAEASVIVQPTYSVKAAFKVGIKQLPEFFTSYSRVQFTIGSLLFFALKHLVLVSQHHTLVTVTHKAPGMYVHKSQIKADEGEAMTVWSNAGMQGRRKRETSEKTRRSATSYYMIPTCENPLLS
ncbi:hypothetical protein PR048_032428 [Dryococelus australis]|uniref:Uncharacterized protein n=1 Tax=Dryococelus australis TaxID=614101 RepID=A0ABQ9G268_9NEOP|nr:hypothetical protein PR048_032428 [Dryococelus australis]